MPVKLKNNYNGFVTVCYSIWGRRDGTVIQAITSITALLDRLVVEIKTHSASYSMQQKKTNSLTG